MHIDRMHIEELTDEVAAKPQAAEIYSRNSSNAAPSSTSKLSNRMTSGRMATPDSSSSLVPQQTTGPALSPGRAMTSNKTVEEVYKDLNESPLFMNELVENDDVEALRALAYEGTPLENGTDFKDRGNECFAEKRWADAKEFYGKGIQILAAEEKKRAGNDTGTGISTDTSIAKDEVSKNGADSLVGETDYKLDGSTDTSHAPLHEEIAQERKILETLYVNRAACHLELRNYRSSWLDCGSALSLNPRNVKAYYRSTRALLAVDRITEALDACARGLALDSSNAALRAVSCDIAKRNELLTVKQKRQAELEAKEKRCEMFRLQALRTRGIRTRTTTRPPDMEDARMRLSPNEDDVLGSTLEFPTVLLYPDAMKSDFIKAFNETETVAEHLDYIFPLPWDEKREYTLENAECYMDTIPGGLIKVGKKVMLLNVLKSGGVEVVDEMVRLYVVPKNKAEGWVAKHKKKKAAETGGS